MQKSRLIPLFLPLTLLAVAPGVTAAEKDKSDKVKKERQIEQQRERYKALPAAKRKQIRNVRDKYQKLPADQKRKLREKYKKQQQNKKKK